MDDSFNLAIEMLVISGHISPSFVSICASFQSRNRDACHFRLCHQLGLGDDAYRFNLAIEMLVISGFAFSDVAGLAT